MYRFAVLDDEYEFLNKIKLYFIEYKNIFVDLYTDPYELIEQAEQYDVIFADYDMPIMNAFRFFELTTKMRYLKIVITNYDQVIFDSLRYDIFYFVRKKNIDIDLPVCVEKILRELDEINNEKLVIQSYNHIISVCYREIRYIETEKNYIIIHALTDFKIRCTFKKLVSLINHNHFVIVSYGMMVNIEYVMHIDLKNMLVVMDGGLALSLSRKYKEKVKKKYQEYLLS